MTHPPFTALRLSIVLVLAAGLLAGLGIVWSRGQAQEAHGALVQQQAAYDTAQRTLERSREQQQLIEAHLAAYQALVARGFIGAEERLAWIEAAQLANHAAGLAGLDYRLAPRTASDPALAQGLALGHTTMVLKMPLLVETDLTRFLTLLEDRAPGVHRVKGCRLSRSDSAPFEAVNTPRLQAECELLWYTVAPLQGGTP